MISQSCILHVYCCRILGYDDLEVFLGSPGHGQLRRTFRPSFDIFVQAMAGYDDARVCFSSGGDNLGFCYL